jgi:hypothetical protein
LDGSEMAEPPGRSPKMECNTVVSVTEIEGHTREFFAEELYVFMTRDSLAIFPGWLSGGCKDA